MILLGASNPPLQFAHTLHEAVIAAHAFNSVLQQKEVLPSLRHCLHFMWLFDHQLFVEATKNNTNYSRIHSWDGNSMTSVKQRRLIKVVFQFFTGNSMPHLIEIVATPVIIVRLAGHPKAGMHKAGHKRTRKAHITKHSKNMHPHSLQ